MKTFKNYLTESGHASLSRAGAIALVLRIRTMHTRLQKEDDLASKIDLLSEQNVQISYLIALNLAHSLGDRGLIQRFRTK